MKHKKELRWLVFLLIPFTILFALHLFIPLIIKQTDHQLSLQKYRDNVMSTQKKSIISSHYNNFRAVSSTLASYFNQLNVFFNLFLQKQENFLHISQSSIKSVNAYDYATSLQNNSEKLSTKIDGVMWFSTQNRSISELSPPEQQILDQFITVQPLISSKLSSYVAMDSFSIYLVTENSSLYVQSPIQYAARFQHLNGSPVDNFYIQTMKAYQNNGNMMITVSFYQNDNISNKSLLVVCKASGLSALPAVACLKVKLELLGVDLQNQVRVGQNLYFSSMVDLLLSNDVGNTSNQNPQIVLQFNDPDNNTANVPSNAYFNIDGTPLSASLFSSTLNTAYVRLFISQNNSILWCISSITNSDGGNPVLHLVTTSQIGSAQLLPEELKGNLNTIIIPVSLLALVFTLLNCYIMKKLMQSVDNELFELDQRCKFIAEGDLNVKVPKHNRSKDMSVLYNRIKIINKLHRYSDKTYFVGHPSQKILKYNEALQLIKELEYDSGNLYENIGESYNYLNEWSKSLVNLRQSISIIIEKIEEKYGTIDEILERKIKKCNLSLKYREKELILIRRLFKIIFVYIRFFQVGYNPKNEEINVKLEKKYEKYKIECGYYINLFKKAIYPNISKLAEGTIVLFFQVRLLLLDNRTEQAELQQKRAVQIFKMYSKTYPIITKILEEKKRSSHKFLFASNKLTDFSRSSPSLLVAIQNLVKTYRENICNPNPQKYMNITELIYQICKIPSFFIGTTHLLVKEFRNMLITLKIDPIPFETTKIFKQNIPFFSLHDGPITHQNQTQLLKIARKNVKGLQREYVLLFDCERNLGRDQSHSDSKDYFLRQGDHLFGKLIQPRDRISIMKFNTKEGIKIQCGLTIKQSNEQILKKEIDESIAERSESKNIENDLFDAVQKAIQRIKHLLSEKVIIVFFRSIEHYRMHSQKSIKKRRSTKRSSINSMISSEGVQLQFQDFGDHLVYWLEEKDIRNLKIILFCAKNDSIEKFREYFGLDNVNRRLWLATEGLNTHNKVVYVIEQRHKNDIDRVLMLKALDVPDNNVFVL